VVQRFDVSAHGVSMPEPATGSVVQVSGMRAAHLDAGEVASHGG
jgi:hypothetical protein